MRNAGIALALVVVLVVALGVLGRGRNSTSSDATSGADASVAYLEFKAEKGERQSYGQWAGLTYYYFRVTSLNEQPIQLARVIVNGRSDQTECVIEYNDQVLKMGDTISKDVDTSKCGDIVQITIVTSEPAAEMTYKF